MLILQLFKIHVNFYLQAAAPKVKGGKMAMKSAPAAKPRVGGKR